MWMMRRIFILCVFMVQPISAEQQRYQVFDEKHLLEGRSVWMQNCEACHGWGVADAPIPMEPEQWEARVKQPMETLYSHAINGFFGPDDSMMPPRGGNESLSDGEVKSAVDYMVNLARYHINSKPVQ